MKSVAWIAGLGATVLHPDAAARALTRRAGAEYLRAMERARPSGDRGPLGGIRVVDFSHVLAGPMATMLLGDLGAEILKVEIPSGGDSTRRSGPPFQHGESAYFLSHNRNKKSLVVDLKRPAGRALAERLIATADIVAESYRPGVMDRLGLGYERARELKPDVIYAALSAYGSTGPYKDRPGFELIIQSLTGLVAVTTPPGGPPAKIQIQVVDLCSGMFLAIAILAALHHRDRTGEGQKVETSLLESTIAMMANLVGITLMSGRAPEVSGTRNPQVMPSQALRTRDGHISVVTQPQHWARFCRALERPEWIEDAQLSDPAHRVEHRGEVEQRIEAVTRTRTTAEWQARFQAHDVAAGPVRRIDELFDDPQVAALNLVRRLTHAVAGEVALLAPPFHLSRTPADVHRPPPALGQHTREVLADLGYAESEIAALHADGTVASG